MAGYNAQPPEVGSVKIRLPFAVPGGVEFDKFLSYEYAEDFLTPSDASSFTLSLDSLTDRDRSALVCGSRVEVSIDGQPQSVSYISKVRTRTDPHGGAIATIECYDWLNRAVKGHVDPNVRFRPSMTLFDLLTTVFEPFGMTVLATDNVANRNAITGRIYGGKVTKKGKPLKSYVLHQIKPYPQEGAFAFACRVSQRFGLWIWPAVDGETVIVGKPDFDQPSRYTLRHKLDASAAQNNVLESEVEFADEEQPSLILGMGFGGGGEFSKTKLKSGIINPIIVTPEEDLAALEQAYPSVHWITPPPAAIISGIATFPIPNPNAVPLYLYDPESHTQEELDKFVLRELSLRMRKSLVCRYTIEGHKLNGQPIAVDTIVDVDDDRSRLHTQMWVLGRRFSKSRTGGTTTVMELIRPGTLVF